ncbi:MAG: hypothetical protein WC082_02360 [Victivallales bacterium]
MNQAIDDLDVEAVKADVLPFVHDRKSLELWSKDFFREIVKAFVEA